MNDDIKETEARNQIVEIGKKHNLYFVIWDGHFSRYFYAMQNNRNLKPEIYGAIYESFYDLVKSDKEMFKLSFKYDDTPTWSKLLEFLNTNLNVSQGA